MQEQASQTNWRARPVCKVEAGYWRDGLRWKVVLQVMYHATPHRGQGPFFAIGHTWRESAARKMVEEANARLVRSEWAMYFDGQRGTTV